MNPVQMLELIFKGSELSPLPKARHIDIERCYLALKGYLEEQIKKEEEELAAQKQKQKEETEKDTTKTVRVPGQMRP